MKKLLIFCLCLLTLAATALSASAATSAGLSPSKTTLYRGDSFTVTVKLSNDRALTDGGLQVSWGSGLKLVSGSCNIGGITIGGVSTGNGMCSFAFDTGVEKVVSGTAFTLTFQVADTAAFGSASISISGSVRNLNDSYPVSASCAVSIACKHSYADAAKTDDTNHLLTCKHCKATKSEKHSFTSQVLEAATCKKDGSEKLTCTACGHSKTQVISKTNAHSYGSWSKVNDDKHKHTCTVCGKEETAAHTWNSGTVTKAATCTATGTRSRTCTGCKATKTETVPKSASHPYTDWKAVDEKTHTHRCPVCGKEETLAHTYSDWSHDELNHYQLCTGCGQRSEQAAHIPGPAPTETTGQTCTVCQRVLQPSTAHVHEFGSDWDFDESCHWHGCAQCTEKQGLNTHTFTDDCDESCDVCGAVRQAPHSPDAQWSADGSSHWLGCAACGGRVQEAAHTPGPEATLQNAQNCTVCSWTVAPKLTHDTHSFSAQHTHLCECGEAHTAGSDCALCAQFPWWWVVIGLETLALACALFFLLRKKHIPLYG